MDDAMKEKIRACLAVYNEKFPVKQPEDAASVDDIMAAMDWSEDRTRRKLRDAVRDGRVEVVQVGQRKYYRIKGELK